jgi:hypothetical protein
LRCAKLAVAGSSMSRHTAAWINSSTCSARIADFASTARPAAAEASEGRVPAGHTRRSRMPVISSKRPSGKRSR